MLRLKELRKAHRETQADIASLIGVTRGAYANIENGKREPDFETIITLANHFGVSTDYLLGLDEAKEKPTPMEGGGLSETGKQIMECVRQMSDREREALLAWLQASQGRG